MANHLEWNQQFIYFLPFFHTSLTLSGSLPLFSHSFSILHPLPNHSYMLRGCSVILSLSVIKQESPPQPQEVCSADGADWLSLRIQSEADICWDQNPKADNLHTVWPSTQPCVCMSECYTLVSWSYLSFFHAERGRLGRRGHVAALLLQAVVHVEKFLKLHHISHSERT